MSPRIRVLVVDDSAFARKVLREILGGGLDIDVVGFARDGLDALEKIESLRPDVVTLDLVMPHLDGLGVLQALPASGGPRVLIVSVSSQESDLGLQALHLGAVDIVQKPTALATGRLFEMSAELLRKVRLAASLPRSPPRLDAPPSRALAALPPVASAPSAAAGRVVVVGTSTGGPQALARLCAALPADLPAPVAVVVHIPVGYTTALAQRLDQGSPLSVVEAWDGLELLPGMVVIARAGLHLRLERQGERLLARLDHTPTGSPHRPSVDVLFESAARHAGSGALGVILTGMGDDGLLGSRAIHEAGGHLLIEDESSCIVYGMPRCIQEAGIADLAAPLDELPAEIVRRLAPRGA